MTLQEIIKQVKGGYHLEKSEIKQGIKELSVILSDLINRLE